MSQSKGQFLLPESPGSTGSADAADAQVRNGIGVRPRGVREHSSSLAPGSNRTNRNKYDLRRHSAVGHNAVFLDQLADCQRFLPSFAGAQTIGIPVLETPIPPEQNEPG